MVGRRGGYALAWPLAHERGGGMQGPRAVTPVGRVFSLAPAVSLPSVMWIIAPLVMPPSE